MWPSFPQGHAEFVSNRTISSSGTKRERKQAMTISAILPTRRRKVIVVGRSGKVNRGVRLPMSNPSQMYAKPVLAVLPCLLEHETALAQNRFDHSHRVLVAVLRMNALAGGELYVQVDRRQEHVLRPVAFEVDFHARAVFVPQR